MANWLEIGEAPILDRCSGRYQTVKIQTGIPALIFWAILRSGRFVQSLNLRFTYFARSTDAKTRLGFAVEKIGRRFRLESIYSR
jgi:hypothetical protein